MTETQINNITAFCFCLHNSMGTEIMYQSPTYILEKWQRCIGCNVKIEEGLHDDIDSYYEIQKWLDMWKPNKEFVNKYLGVINLLFHLNTSPLNMDCDLNTLIDLFKEYINVEEVNDVRQYNGLHQILASQMEFWLGTKENKRIKKLKILNNCLFRNK